MKNHFKKAPVVGLIRYSQKIKFGKTELEKDVFEPEYFEYRFKIFENITLKCFKQQTNKNFLLFLLHSESMPLELKSRFIELEHENPFLCNVYLKDNEDSLGEFLASLENFVSFENGVCITFRIDNDDAVPKNFIQLLYGYLNNEFNNYGISMPYFSIVQRKSNTYFMVEERYYPSNSMGLALVSNEMQFKTIMHLGYHNRINKTNPIVLIAANTGIGLMIVNGENAANYLIPEKSKTMNEDDLKQYLREKNIENLDLTCLREMVEINKKVSFSIKEMIKLLVPPFLILLVRKIKN
jgi:hypothetical protein